MSLDIALCQMNRQSTYAVRLVANSEITHYNPAESQCRAGFMEL